MSTPRKNPPSANVLMNSIRSIGYTFESAIADIIDNSISAEAKNIQIIFPSDPRKCFVEIFDDGKGMTLDELYEAMKYGSSVEGGKRSEYDLGRFGLGLKSASLSQCKKLTVISKKQGKLSGYIWDLDYISPSKDDWWIQELSQEEIGSHYELGWLEGRNQGTMVVWENFDTIEKTSGNVFYSLNDYKSALSDHLQLIFHRYLNEEKDKKVIIKIDEYELVGFDPFLEKYSHKKATNEREISIPVIDSEGTERFIAVKPFVLPFQKDLTEADIKKIGGMENYQTGQGFYIYRNKRLIIWGTWFRMRRRYIE